MPDHHEEHFDSSPLTEAENKYVRQMIRNDQHWSWLWATLRVWAGWATAAGGVIYAAFEPLSRMIRAALGIK